jgi:hypothetical protein
MHRLGDGRFEDLRIERGELVLDSSPMVIPQVKFGASDPGCEKDLRAEFKLMEQLAQLFEYIRSVDAGRIQILEIRGGLPFAMQVVQAQASKDSLTNLRIFPVHPAGDIMSDAPNTKHVETCRTGSEVSNWKPYTKDTLQLFLSLFLPSKMTLRGCSDHRKDDGDPRFRERAIAPVDRHSNRAVAK